MPEHLCNAVADLNLSKGFKLEIKKSNGSWLLSQSSLAIEVDVNGGEAEFIGEEMSRSDLKIKFCPYCGVRLD